MWRKLQMYLTVLYLSFDCMYYINIIIKIDQRHPTWEETRFLQSRNYFCYIPCNDREVEILVLTLSIVTTWHQWWWMDLIILLRGTHTYKSDSFTCNIRLNWYKQPLRTLGLISINHMSPQNHWGGLSTSGILVG